MSTTTASNASPDNTKVLEKLLAKFDGDANTVALKLIRLNTKLGADLAAAEAKATAAESRAATAEGKVVDLEPLQAKVADLEAKLKSNALPEGHVAVAKADADALAAYKALGDPAKLKGDVEALPRLQSEIADRDREKEIEAVASTLKYVPSVLKDRAAGMTFVPTKGKLHGKEFDTFDVVDKDADGKERRRPISEVEQSDWKEYMPALKHQAAPAERTMPVGGSPYRGAGRPTPEPPRAAAARVAAGEDREAKLQSVLANLPRL